MARIAYVFDGTMSKLGLQGKAMMPFIVSFGCNIGGVSGARVIDNWGQRVLTMALSWVIPCVSTWGVISKERRKKRLDYGVATSSSPTL